MAMELMMEWAVDSMTSRRSKAFSSELPVTMAHWLFTMTTGVLLLKIFAVPGIGRAFVNSITGRDYPLIMGTTIVLASLIVIMNLISDLLYKAVDPRITLE